MTPSPQQRAIIEAFGDTRSIVVNALAGTGKTTTIAQAVANAPELRGGVVLALAFNKHAADDLARKLPPGAQAATLHSLGLRILRDAGFRSGVDGRHAYRDADRAVDEMYAPRAITRQVARLVASAASAAKVRLWQPDAIEAGIRAIGLEITEAMEQAGWGVPRLATATRRALDHAAARVADDAGLTFDDMVWAPIILGLARPHVDLVIVDEAQDLNASRLDLAARVCRGRFVAVGDENQSIYRWNGAIPAALDRVVERFDAVRLPLTVTWRCAADIVEVARSVVPTYEARPGAPRGEVVRGEVADAQPGELLLARTNAAVMRSALSLIRRQRPAAVVGKDVQDRLLQLLNGAAEGAGSHASVQRVIGLANRLAEDAALRAEAESMDTLAAEIRDMAATLDVVAEGLPTVEAVATRIRHVIRSMRDPDAVSCMTVHKAKGAEAEGVTVVADSLRGAERLSEEGCVTYVALSRAKSRMVMVGESPEPVEAAVRRVAPERTSGQMAIGGVA